MQHDPTLCQNVQDHDSFGQPRLAHEDMPTWRQAEYAYNMERLTQLAEERDQKTLSAECRDVIAQELSRLNFRQAQLECRTRPIDPPRDAPLSALAAALRTEETSAPATPLERIRSAARLTRLRLRIAEVLSAPIQYHDLWRAHAALDDLAYQWTSWPDAHPIHSQGSFVSEHGRPYTPVDWAIFVLYNGPYASLFAFADTFTQEQSARIIDAAALHDALAF